MLRPRPKKKGRGRQTERPPERSPRGLLAPGGRALHSARRQSAATAAEAPTRGRRNAGAPAGARTQKRGRAGGRKPKAERDCLRAYGPEDSAAGRPAGRAGSRCRCCGCRARCRCAGRRGRRRPLRWAGARCTRAAPGAWRCEAVTLRGHRSTATRRPCGRAARAVSTGGAQLVAASGRHVVRRHGVRRHGARRHD